MRSLCSDFTKCRIPVSILIFTRRLFLQSRRALSLASPICGSGVCLDALVLARFLLNDRIGGQPTTGAAAPLYQIRAR